MIAFVQILDKCHLMGRIDPGGLAGPVLHYAGSYLSARFRSSTLRVTVSDEGGWNENANDLGVVIDGDLTIHPLLKGQSQQKVEVACPPGAHDLEIYKLQGPGNGRGSLTLHGLDLAPGGELLPPSVLPARKLEAYGDSVTEGEGSLCAEGTHDCGTNSGWHSYTNRLARALDVQIHNNGVGGLEVRDHTGWYESGDTGLETTFDKLNPCGSNKTPWDFSRYTPDLVLMAMGVNDQSKHGFDDLPLWKESFKRIVREIRARHGGGDLPFLFAVAPINVREAYRYVAEVVAELRAEGLNAWFYRYSFEVSGHPNGPESELMACELEKFIRENRLI
ncbi:MAG: hypothetical protein JW987_09580 [Anaerolineaceae bacterium]|nr:hypothetical protein [Anaerolineaceae bacterium]